MRLRLPTSRGFFQIRLSPFDVFWGFVSPWLALWSRDPTLFSTTVKLQTTTVYCVISFAFAIIAFLAFRIRDGLSHYFSVHDALDVAKAVVFSELMTCVILFTFTRLDNIPRSTPLIHALVLGAGLVTARTLMRVLYTERSVSQARQRGEAEHIIVIGSTQIASLYIKLVESYAPGSRRFIGMLDDRPHMVGRSISGVRILGPPQHLQPVIDEFTEHGIRTDRVIVGGDQDMLPKEVMDEIEDICRQRDIKLDYVPALIGLNDPQTPEIQLETAPAKPAAPDFSPPRYIQIRRFIDFSIALLLSLLLLPLFVLISIIVLIDVGSPVLFWQQRIGMGGRTFLLYKFRSLKPSFDWHGQPVPAAKRLSWIGTTMRKLRLDELPQLLNVLVGDMSLIGPRPLLPHDQPVNPTVRLSVRPGITGWAQVNGGRSLTPEQKNELDEWYVCNASVWLDLRILLMTTAVVLRGEGHRDNASRRDSEVPRNDLQTQRHIEP